MQPASVLSLWIGVRDLVDRLDGRCLAVLSGEPAFVPMAIKEPKTSPPELAFYQTVSWLFAYYFEAGRLTLPFLMELFPTYQIDHDGSHAVHRSIVRDLRTFMQHNLDLASNADLRTKSQCESWFAAQCGTPSPEDDTEWLSALLRVLYDSTAFLKDMDRCVANIEGDRYGQIITDQWHARLLRHHPKHEFETVVAQVMHDIGQSHHDPGQITNRYYDRWSAELRNWPPGYVFVTEARKLVEHALLHDQDPLLPITTSDIMRTFAIRPGPMVGHLWRQARAIYLADPASADSLLEKLVECEEAASRGRANMP